MLKQGIRAFTALALVMAAANAAATPPADFEQRVEQLRKEFGVPGVTIAPPDSEPGCAFERAKVWLDPSSPH